MLSKIFDEIVEQYFRLAPWRPSVCINIAVPTLRTNEGCFLTPTVSGVIYVAGYTIVDREYAGSNTVN